MAGSEGVWFKRGFTVELLLFKTNCQLGLHFTKSYNKLL